MNEHELRQLGPGVAKGWAREWAKHDNERRLTWDLSTARAELSEAEATIKARERTIAEYGEKLELAYGEIYYLKRNLGQLAAENRGLTEELSKLHLEE